MPRVTVNLQSPMSYPSLPPAADALDIALTPADPVNLQQTPMTAGFYLIALNTGTASHTLTITSVPDAKGRTGDITAYALEPGDLVMLRFDSTEGWRQPDGMLYYEASNAAIKFAAIPIG
jgi:hypothetical protein